MVKEQEHGEIVWHNGRLIPWHEATIHVMAHVVNYGSSVFEGIRCYDTRQGPGIFRLAPLSRRAAPTGRRTNAAQFSRIEPPFGYDEMFAACRELVPANGYRECYLRPV